MKRESQQDDGGNRARKHLLANQIVQTINQPFNQPTNQPASPKKKSKKRARPVLSVPAFLSVLPRRCAHADLRAEDRRTPAVDRHQGSQMVCTTDSCFSIWAAGQDGAATASEWTAVKGV